MGKKYTVGVLIGNAHSDHPKELMRGIHDAAEKKDINIAFFLGTQSTSYYRELVKDSEDYDYQYNTIYDYAMLAQVDVLIIAYGSLCIFQRGQNKDAFLGKFAGVPYVILEDVAGDQQGVHLIADNYDGIRQCVEHLILKHNSQHICFLSGPLDNRDAEERLLSYRETMQRNGREVTEDMIAYGDYSEYVERQVELLLKRNPQADAIVSANDAMTVAIYRVCAKRGLKIGKDIAVTGFDNIHMSEYKKPPLTTVTQDGYRMGALAFQKACHIIEKKMEVSERIPVEFICRESCGCKRQGTEYIGKKEAKDLKDTIEELRVFQHMAWMGPFVMRDLMQESNDEKQFFTKAVKAMRSVGAQRVLIYMLKKPLEYTKGSEWKRPAKISLAASYLNGRITTYTQKERPLISERHRLFDHNDKSGKPFIYMNFLLFEGARQYGILTVEIEPEAIPYFYLMSLQLGTSLRFYEMSRKERIAKRNLKEKNKVLSLIAGYDELTGIYNRRGIMENAMEFNRVYHGKQAYFMIGDLDHLKQINDLYGHPEGDNTIRVVANILKEILGSYGDVGRIGGDEFVAIVSKDCKIDKEALVEKIYKRCEEYNLGSGKPYYVNLSIGMAEFTCGEQFDFKEMIKSADEFLYQAKRERRKSVDKIAVSRR